VDGVLYQNDRLLVYPSRHGDAYDVIPGTKSIHSEAFRGNEVLTSITLPTGLIELPNGLFYGCTALRGVSLPLTLQRIRASVFSDCISLSRIVLPGNLQSIDAYAFYNCVSLTEVSIPDSVTEVSPDAFKACPSLSIRSGMDSPARMVAWKAGLPWAELSGDPAVIENIDFAEPTVLVNNPSADEMLALRAEPSPNGKSLGSFANGSCFQWLGEQDGWTQVRQGDTEGYLPTQSLMRMDPCQQLAVPLYARPLHNNPSVTRMKLFSFPSESALSQDLDPSAILRIQKVVGSWYQVETEGMNGFLPAAGLLTAGLWKDSSQYGIAIVNNPNQRDRLHLRAEPSRQSQSLGRFFNGTQVEWLDGELGEWLKVRIGDIAGYMMAEYLFFVQTPSSDPDLPFGNG